MRLTLRLFKQEVIRQYIPPARRPLGVAPGLWEHIRHLRLRIVGQPTVIKDEIAKKALSEMPKEAYYAVHTGLKPGIYKTWAETEAQVKGFTNAKHRKFPTEAGAREFMQGSTWESKSAPQRDVQSTLNTNKSSHRAATSAPYRRPDPKIESSTPKRPSSPPILIDPSLLPPDLQAISDKGYSFSKDKRLVAYTDGSGLGNGKVGARAGLGVYWGEKGEAYTRNLSERVPGYLQTNNRGELLSVIRAVEECPYPSIPLEIRTDSQYTISCMTTFLPKWFKNGFRTGPTGGQEVKNSDLIKHLIVLLRRRKPTAGVRFKYVKAHVGLAGNEMADKLAKRGALMPEIPDRDEWLDPDTAEDDFTTGQDSPIDVDVEIDESWLLTEDEMNSLEKDFKLQP